MNIAHAIALQAAQQAEAVAIYTSSDSVTWAGLDRAVHSITNQLFSAGIGSGTVVALSLRDERLAVAAMLAVARLGATSVSLPVTEVAPVKSQIVARTQATVLLRDGEVEGVSGLFASELVLSTDALYAASSAAPASSPCDMDPQAPCFLVVGSGTTGTPKLIPISHEIFRLRAEVLFETLAMTAADRLATVSRIDFWVSKLGCLTALSHGVPIVLANRQADFIEQCRRLGVTILFLSAIHLEQMLKQLTRKHERPLDFLRVVSAGGAMVTESLRRRTLKHLASCLHIPYGTNDFGLITMAKPDDIRAVPGTVGPAVKFVEIEIRDRQNQVLPAGTTGEIWLRSKAMITAYHNDPEATARDFNEGWFKPGDLGALSPSGQLIHYGRSDQMMVMNGVNIAPAEIENCLCAHPAVADASAFPLHHPVHQHIPVCAVELHEGATASQEELSDFAAVNLGSHSPSRVIILSEIPRNEMGKVRRGELARQVAKVLGIPFQS